MNIKEFKKLIKERIYQDEECYGEDAETIEKIQTQLTKLILDNIKEIIEYIKTDCSFCEFQYLTEIICEVISISQNEELVNAYNIIFKYKFVK